MPRKPRVLGDGCCYHVILRCNNHERLLMGKEFSNFLHLLKKYKNKFALRIYDYVLMQSHVHLLLSTHDGHPLNVAMHGLCLAFSKQYNWRNERAGHFWRDRYWCRVVRDDRYAIACMRYFARNPVKAGIVTEARQWSWSGYHFYAGLNDSGLVEPHPSYLMMGSTAAERQKNYRSLIRMPAHPKEECLFGDRCQHASQRFQTHLKPFAVYLTVGVFNR